MHRYPHSPQAVAPPSTDLDHAWVLIASTAAAANWNGIDRDRQRDKVASVFAGQRQA